MRESGTMTCLNSDSRLSVTFSRWPQAVAAVFKDIIASLGLGKGSETTVNHAISVASILLNRCAALNEGGAHA
jgi:hypothetical protein